MSPHLSIVIPNYNHGKHLRGVVESCFLDGFQDLEVIVVDDASTDDSRRILADLCKEYSDLKLINLEENVGPCHASNTGMEHASGDWIFFRAADDLFPAGSLLNFRDAVIQFPDAGLITGDLQFFDGVASIGTTEKMGRAEMPVYVGLDNFVSDYGGNIIHGASTFCLKSLAITYGGMNPLLKWHSDWFLFMSIALIEGFAYVPSLFGRMRLDPQSYNSAGTLSQPSRDSVLCELLDHIDNIPELPERIRQVGCCDFFGEPLMRQVRKCSSHALKGIGDGLLSLSAEHERARRETGIPYVISQFLQEHCSMIAQHKGDVVIFGAGGHSLHLLKMWRELGLLDPIVVLDNYPGGERQKLEGIDVEEPSHLRHLKDPLVVLSSKSYEPQFAATVQGIDPRALILKIWGNNSSF